MFKSESKFYFTTNMAAVSHDSSMEYDKEYIGKMRRLVDEMGFGKVEAQMALKDSNGNVDSAVEKLISGQYNPPPYTPTDTDVTTTTRSKQSNNQGNSSKSSTVDGVHNITTFFSDLLHRNKTPTFEDKPTAPPVFEIDPIEPTKRSTYDIDDMGGLPPPYEKIHKSGLIEEWEKKEKVFHMNLDFEAPNAHEIMPWGEEERCSVCFDPLVKVKGDAKKNDIVQQQRKYYHNSCFIKYRGPKCDYCCFPLSEANKDHELSGHYLKYKNKDYHVECYEKYAGPRCCYCFNVIIERPNGEFSGNWIVDGRKEYHFECYKKKMEIDTKKY